MRVLHLASSFPRRPDDHVGTFLLDLMHAQQQAGLDVVVLAPHDAQLPAVDTVDGIEVRRFRYGPGAVERLSYRGGLMTSSRTPAAALLPAYFASFSWAAQRLTRELRPDVVHAHWWLPAGLCAMPARRRLGVPLVVTVHGSDAHLLRQRALRRLAHRVLRGADLVATVSADLQRQVDRFDPALQPVVLRLPLAAAVTASPVVAPSPAPPLRLLAAGRLAPEKGFDVLLDAAALAVRRGLDLSLEIVGSGPEHRRLAARAWTEPLAGRVRLTPALPHAELLRRLDGVHALVAPSRREGLGLVALEALARGRAVVASSVGGLTESVDNFVDGFLVPPGDPVALADAFTRLPLPEAPRGAALALHDPVEVGRTHREAYDSLVARGGAGR